MKSLFVLLLLTFFAFALQAQEQYIDVIYLKNGNVLRGTIIEQVPSEYVKLKTSDGSEFVFRVDEIERITKEENPVYLLNENVSKRGYVGVTLGVSIPVGDFADPNNGAAKAGVQINLLNVGFLFSEKFGIGFTWFGAANPLDFPGLDPWTYGGLMIGPIFTTQGTNKIEFDARMLLGYFNATVPDIGLGTENDGNIGLNLGGVVRYNFSDNLALMLTLDYLSSNIDFPGYGFTQRFSVVSINGGVALRL